MDGTMKITNYAGRPGLGHLSERERRRAELINELAALVETIRHADTSLATYRGLQRDRKRVDEIKRDLAKLEETTPADFVCACCRTTPVDCDTARYGVMLVEGIGVFHKREQVEDHWIGSRPPLSLGICENCLDVLLAVVRERVGATGV
jgi:hypothetical protein